jgi:hypothetical protein
MQGITKYGHIRIPNQITRNIYFIFILLLFLATLGATKLKGHLYKKIKAEFRQ